MAGGAPAIPGTNLLITFGADSGSATLTSTLPPVTILPITNVTVNSVTPQQITDPLGQVSLNFTGFSVSFGPPSTPIPLPINPISFGFQPVQITFDAFFLPAAIFAPPPPPANITNNNGLPSSLLNPNSTIGTAYSTTIGTESSAGALIDLGTGLMVTLNPVNSIDAGAYTNVDTGETVFIKSIASAEPGTYVNQNNNTVVVVKPDAKTGKNTATAGQTTKSTRRSLKALAACK